MTNLTSAQTTFLNTLRSFGANAPMVAFAAQPEVKALIRKGYITFSPTAFGAGYVRMKVGS